MREVSKKKNRQGGRKRFQLRQDVPSVQMERRNTTTTIQQNTLTGSREEVIEDELEFTRETEDSFVSVKDCKKCPSESGCLNMFHSSGDSICVCYHFIPPLPMRKGIPCARKIVFSSKSEEWQENHTNLTKSIQIQLPGDTSSIRDVRSTFAYTFVGGAVIAAILSLIFVIICVIKRRSLHSMFYKKGSKNKMEMVDVRQRSGLHLLPTDRFVSNPTYEAQTSCLQDLAIPIFSPEAVNLSTQIGQGCFGKVFKGVIEGDLVVAIKVVKKEYSEEAVKEVETMATFSHPNILHLIGIVQSSDFDAPWLIFEFMKYGDLASVLRNGDNRKSCPSLDNKSPQHLTNGESHGSDGVDEECEEKLQLTNESLLDFAAQIAEGLKYLSSQHFVHRDIAARNCLVSANGMVKISDFGLSRDVYTCDYYKIGGSRLLPLRWMAPESILYGRFTLESDVWAYGILLWEIFSWGKQPYFGHSNEEVVQLILDGVLLCPPSDCPVLICKIMEGCWKTEPKDRLKFPQIGERISIKDFSKHSEVQYEWENKKDNLQDEMIPGLSPSFKKSSCTNNPTYHLPQPSILDTWINSGYEVPRSILLEKEYIHVVPE